MVCVAAMFGYVFREVNVRLWRRFDTEALNVLLDSPKFPVLSYRVCQSRSETTRAWLVQVNLQDFLKAAVTCFTYIHDERKQAPSVSAAETNQRENPSDSQESEPEKKMQSSRVKDWRGTDRCGNSAGWTVASPTEEMIRLQTSDPADSWLAAKCSYIVRCVWEEKIHSPSALSY